MKKYILILILIFYTILSFSNDKTFKLFIDKNQNLWIYKNNKLIKLNDKTVKIIKLKNNKINYIFENDKHIFFITKNYKLFCYINGKLKKIRLNKKKIKKIKSLKPIIKIKLNNIELYFLSNNIIEYKHLPFYKKIWFYILIIIIITIIFYLLYKLRIKTIKQQQEIKKTLETYQYQALNKQMNPHFIFNSLNSIQNYILQNDKKNSNKYLIKFSQLMRMVLNNTQSHIITIDKEIKALILYLELEQIRFKNRFNYEINIDKNVDIYAYKIPPLLLQPFVENAIWHGLMNMPIEHKGKIIININIKHNFIIIEIIDNGIGREKATEIDKQKIKNSLSTKINKDRATLFNEIFNLKIKIKYVDLLDSKGKSKGTKVIIKLDTNLIK